MISKLLLLLAIPSICSAQMQLTYLGDLPGGETRSEAIAVSDDGSVVVGNSWSDMGKEAFLWNEPSGIQSLGPRPEGVLSSSAVAVSSDGSTVLGNFYFENATQPFLWTPLGGYQLLGDLLEGDFDLATGMSADSSVVVGYSNDGSAATSVGFIWTQEGVTSLGYEGDEAYAVLGVSRDGTKVLGYIRYSEDFSPDGKEVSYDGLVNGESVQLSKFVSREAFTWDRQNGFELFPLFSRSEPLDGETSPPVDWTESVLIDDDGFVYGRYFNDFVSTCRSIAFVGRGSDTELDSFHAPCTTDVEIGCIHSGTDIHGVTVDGELLVGNVWSNDFSASIWDDQMNYYSLFDTLLMSGVGLGDFRRLDIIQSVSSDGRFMVGSGINSNRETIAYLVSNFPKRGLGMESGSSQIDYFLGEDGVPMIKLDPSIIGENSAEISSDLSTWIPACTLYYNPQYFSESFEGEFKLFLSYPNHYVRFTGSDGKNTFLRLQSPSELRE